MIGRSVALLLMATWAASAPAQVITIESSNPLPKDTGSGHPDRIICEKQETTGSRLGARKVCMTQLQWQQKRQEQREDFEKVQRVVNQEPAGG